MTTKQRILTALEQLGNASIALLAHHLSMKPRTIEAQLIRMLKAHQVTKPIRGLYAKVEPAKAEQQTPCSDQITSKRIELLPSGSYNINVDAEKRQILIEYAHETAAYHAGRSSIRPVPLNDRLDAFRALLAEADARAAEKANAAV